MAIPSASTKAVGQKPTTMRVDAPAGRVVLATPTSWSGAHFVVPETRLTFGRQYRIGDGQGRLLAFCKQKMFRLREDIRFYTDESLTVELFSMRTAKILDFNMNFQIRDSLSSAV